MWHTAHAACRPSAQRSPGGSGWAPSSGCRGLPFTDLVKCLVLALSLEGGSHLSRKNPCGPLDVSSRCPFPALSSAFSSEIHYTGAATPVRHAPEAAQSHGRWGASPPPGGWWCQGAAQPTWATAARTLRPGCSCGSPLQNEPRVTWASFTDPLRARKETVLEKPP